MRRAAVPSAEVAAIRAAIRDGRPVDEAVVDDGDDRDPLEYMAEKRHAAELWASFGTIQAPAEAALSALSEREIELCAKKNIDPAKYLATKRAVRRGRP